MTLYFLGMTSAWVLIPLYVQQGLGFSAFEAGMVGIPSALLSAYSANWAGKRVNSYGRKVVIGGLSMAIFGLLRSLAVVLLHEYLSLSIWWLLVTLGFFGLGQGSVVSPNQALTLAEVPLTYDGSAGRSCKRGSALVPRWESR